MSESKLNGFVCSLQRIEIAFEDCLKENDVIPDKNERVSAR